MSFGNFVFSSNSIILDTRIGMEGAYKNPRRTQEYTIHMSVHYTYCSVNLQILNLIYLHTWFLTDQHKCFWAISLGFEI